MLTFNPGPTHLQPGTLAYLESTLHSGYLSASHRSQEFMDMSQAAITGLRSCMGIPDDYHVFYQPSATVAMDTTLRNLVEKRSFHFTHGAFSQRFYATAQEIGIDAFQHESPWERAVNWREAEIPEGVELMTVTHNETSTGLMWPLEELYALRQRYPEPLLAVDATSSFGALAMDWSQADVWFFSVQKCLGLPAGLGILIVSPRAFEQALELKPKVAQWQSLAYMEKKMQLFQTPETPNMLAIALLAWITKSWDLAAIERETKEKATLLYEVELPWTAYIRDAEWRSITTANLEVGQAQAWHERAASHEITLGKGYGSLKESCIRIANFPAISRESIQHLVHVMSA